MNEGPDHGLPGRCHARESGTEAGYAQYLELSSDAPHALPLEVRRDLVASFWRPRSVRAAEGVDAPRACESGQGMLLGRLRGRSLARPFSMPPRARQRCAGQLQRRPVLC